MYLLGSITSSFSTLRHIGQVPLLKHCLPRQPCVQCELEHMRQVSPLEYVWHLYGTTCSAKTITIVLTGKRAASDIFLREFSHQCGMCWRHEMDLSRHRQYIYNLTSPLYVLPLVWEKYPQKITPGACSLACYMVSDTQQRTASIIQNRQNISRTSSGKGTSIRAWTRVVKRRRCSRSVGLQIA